MKIGVALSGCDIGGVSAHSVLRWLGRQGLPIHMISASGVASVSALLYACGFGEKDCDGMMEDFLRQRDEFDLDLAVAELSMRLRPELLAGVRGLAVSSSSISDGMTIAFTNDFIFGTETLGTYPLHSAYDALSSTIGAVDGLGNYLYHGKKLCDYCVQYGCPVFPLYMTGCDKILSVSFVPETPQTPYEILVKRLTLESCPGSDLHIPLLFPDGDDAPTRYTQYSEIATFELENCRKSLFEAIAF